MKKIIKKDSEKEHNIDNLRMNIENLLKVYYHIMDYVKVSLNFIRLIKFLLQIITASVGSALFKVILV